MRYNSEAARASAFSEVATLDRKWGTQAFRDCGRGRPLIMLHSLALSGEMWIPVLDSFAGTRVIAPDTRGHGQSQWSGEQFTIEDLADDVLSLADDLGLAEFDLLGLSMGGSVATVIGARVGDRIRRLVLCDTTAWYGPDAASAWAARAEAARTPDRAALLPFQQNRWFSPEFAASGDQAVALVSRLFVSTSGSAHAAACVALGALDARAQLGSIAAETLVITGSEDYATPPEMAAAIDMGMPNSQLVIWPGLRHLGLLESGGFRNTVTSFLHGGLPVGVSPASGTSITTDAAGEDD